MKRILAPLIVAVLLTFFTFYRIDGFSDSKIQGPLASGIAPLPSQEALQALDQTYRYLAKGRQCFVFASEDGQSVIKFLNYKRFSFPEWVFSLPLSHDLKLYLALCADKRRQRFDATLKSFHLADRYLHSETGLVYLHLQEGADLPPLTVIDGGHRLHRIDLKSTAFVLQRRVTPIYEELENRWKTSGERGLEEGIAAFLAFVQKRCSLLIADDDHDVGINFGFFQNVPILLDPGRLFLDPSMKSEESYRREMKVATKKLRKWLKANHPESVAFLDSKLKEAHFEGRILF
jgi:hypothetical protein